MVEAGRRGDVAEAEVARQRVHAGRRRTEEVPVRRVDAASALANARIACGESKGWLKPMLTTLNLSAPNTRVNASTASDSERVVRRADLEAAGVDEAHQQRLAAVGRRAARVGLGRRAARGRPAARPTAAWLARSATSGSSSAGCWARACEPAAPIAHPSHEPQRRQLHRSNASTVTAASSRLSCTSDAKNDAIAVARLGARASRQALRTKYDAARQRRRPVDRAGTEEDRQQRDRRPARRCWRARCARRVGAPTTTGSIGTPAAA